MTNDTNTLNGALRELGETMAANLTTQGVASTWDEGLTTLAGKILDITPGPGPTPTPASVSLTSDKSILSYADSESATLSATVLDSSSNPIEGVTVEFFKGSTSLGTASTNSSGVATKSYASSGVGDISLKAQVGSLVSETYSIEDCTYYDTLYTDKNSYTISQGNASLTYNNGLTVTGTANTDTLVKNNVLTLPSKYTATFEIIARTGVGTTSFGGLVFDNLLLDFSSNTTNSIRVYNFSNLSNIGNFNKSVIQIGDVLKIEMDTGTVKFYVNNVLKGTYSVTSTGIHYFRTYNNRTLGIKNLKVKPL